MGSNTATLACNSKRSVPR